MNDAPVVDYGFSKFIITFLMLALSLTTTATIILLLPLLAHKASSIARSKKDLKTRQAGR